MSSLIRCPHCNTEFALEPLEEPMKPSLTITRKSVERGSWRDIAEIINSGETYRMLSVEDSLSCKLTDGSFASIDVLDINDEEVAFGFHQSFGDFEMNMRNTNAGGFPESRMLQHLNTNIMKLLPDELLEVIHRDISCRTSEVRSLSVMQSCGSRLCMRFLERNTHGIVATRTKDSSSFSRTRRTELSSRGMDSIPFAGGCVRPMSAAPPSSGLSATSATTTPTTRMAFVPASSSVSLH